MKKPITNRPLLWIMAFHLLLLGVSWTSRAGEMKAGTAKALITPADPKGRILVMGGPAYGVMNDIYARALTLFDGEKRLVIVTYDLNCLDVATPILRSRLKKELGIEPAYFIPLATHNHAAPIQIVPANFDYGRWLADRIFSLIQEAIQHESGPVKLLTGRGRWDFLMSVGNHPVDSEIQVLKVMQAERTMALLFNHPTHPMQASFWRIEPGHPGYALEELEKLMPGTLPMYADACGGNQFLATGTLMLEPLPVVKLIGKKLARVVRKIAQGEMTEVGGKISSRFSVVPLPLAPPISYEEAQNLAARKKIPRDIGFAPYPDPQREFNWLRSLLDHYEKKLPFPTRTTDLVCTDDGFLLHQLLSPREFPCVYEETIVTTVGPLLLVFMQGEVCAPIGMRIKDAYRETIPMMIFAYMGEHNLYIPTRHLVEQNAYQARVIQIQYASPVPWAPTVEDEMVNGVLGLIKQVLNP